MPKHKKSGAAVALFNAEGNMLLLKRSPESRLQGWCLPGGHSLDNEPPDVTASRELLEETGIYMVCTALTYVGNYQAANGLDVALFWADVDNPDVLLSPEHIDWVWTTNIDNGLAGNTGEFMQAAMRFRNERLAPRHSGKKIVTVQLPDEAAERLLKQWNKQDPRMLRILAYFGLKPEDVQPAVCSCFAYPRVVDAECPVHRDDIFESGGE